MGVIMSDLEKALKRAGEVTELQLQRSKKRWRPELFERIGEFTNLVELSVAWHPIDRHRTNVADVALLGELPSLESVDVWTKKLEDVSALARLPQLASLNVRG